ncbi:MAG: aminotransferase class III-fold pyridoxal phosphate-dependent enzyme, partial [Kineosporiaceae bacterium]
GVRGEGLLLAVELDGPVAPAAAAAALDAGYVVNAVAPDALRLAPPLVVTDDQIDAFTADLPAVLDAAGPLPQDPQGRAATEEDT